MKMKSLMLFFMMTVVSVGVIVFGFVFVNGQVGAVELTEETLMGNVDAANGLTAGYRADAGEELHWTADYDFSAGTTASDFRRGEMLRDEAWDVYEDFRFISDSGVPYTTLVKNPALDGLQKGNVQRFYDGLEADASGKIRLADYIDYYPISFRFQFGSKIYNSSDMLEGLKFYEEKPDAVDQSSDYDEDAQLYVDLNRFFRIPVIETEYQKYEALEEGMQVEPVMRQNSDYYQFDPIILLQEENLMDGIPWEHPDLAGNASLDKDGNYAGKTADQYNLKNRLLFVMNNRTAKGHIVDTSQIPGGYGIYELPVETKATASVKYGKRSATVPNPIPLSDQLSMVYPLDEKAEYVDMTMSPDHRYIVVFFVRDGSFYMELVDADFWKQVEVFELFAASANIHYTWGEDCSLAVTNFKDEIALFAKDAEYQQLYRGDVPEGFDVAFFDAGLAIATKDGKVALVQNPLAGDMREPRLACAVIDKSGILYWGKLNSNIRDTEAMQDAELRIATVSSENWARWK